MRKFQLVALALLSCGALHPCFAAQFVDQSHEITQSVGGRLIFAGSAPVQTVTAGSFGLLSQVDLLLRRDAGDIGELALEVWPVVAGGPAGSTPLFSTPIDPLSVPVGSAGYVAVDTAAGGLTFSPGDEFAIAVTGNSQLGGNNASWTRGRPGYEAGDRFERTGDWKIDRSDSDYAFRTWVDGDAALDTLPAIDLTTTSEWATRTSSSGVSVVFTAGDSIPVAHSTISNRNDGALLEFDASGLPAGAEIRGASLGFDVNLSSQNSNFSPAIDVYGYQASGAPTGSNATDFSRFLGSKPIENLGPQTIALDPVEVASQIAESPGIGLNAYQPSLGVGANIVSSRLAEQLPAFFERPTLTIRYETPTGEAYEAASQTEGDFNSDAHVNAADYAAWRDLGGDLNPGGYTEFADAFGDGPEEGLLNDGFDSGDLSNWEFTTGANTNVSFGFPRVESFDVDGDGQADNALRVRLGRSDTTEFGGEVKITQEVLLAEGDYELSVDVASQSLDIGGNTAPGNFALTLNGEVVDQIILNGTLIDSQEVLRNRLSVTLHNVAAGNHEVGLVITRGALNSRAIFQLVDNLSITPTGVAVSALGVPEPTAAGLISLALGFGVASSRRRGDVKRLVIRDQR